MLIRHIKKFCNVKAFVKKSRLNDYYWQIKNMK